MQLKEERLRSLLIRGLVGDASAYHLFLGELTAHLRSFLRRRMSRLPEETEDLVQELSRRYIQMYEEIADEKFQYGATPVLPRIERNLKAYAF